MANKSQTDADKYSILVLQCLRKAVKRSDYYMSFIPPSDVMRDSASPEEVSGAIGHAIDLLRDRISAKDE